MSLQGKLVVVTRSEKGSQEWGRLLNDHGAAIYNLPTITMQPVTLTPDMTNTLGDIRSFDWLVFTSANGIRYLQELAQEIGLKLDSASLPPVAAIGEKTAQAVRAAGMTVGFRPTQSDSQTLGQELQPVEKQKVLLLRTTLASDELARQLELRGGIVTDLSIYQTRSVEEIDDHFSNLLQQRKIDFITFASPSAVEGLVHRLSGSDFEKVQKLPAIAIGLSVVSALDKHGFSNVHMAHKPTPAGVVETLEQLSATK